MKQKKKKRSKSREKKRFQTLRKKSLKWNQEKKVGLFEFAASLNKNLPASERWFQHLWKQHQMHHKTDVFNEPFGRFIPDCRNDTYRYIIEVDGSIHQLEEIKSRDRMRDREFISRGYLVVHVEAFNLRSFITACDIIGNRIKKIEREMSEYQLTRSKGRKVILRKQGDRDIKSHSLFPNP